MPDGRPEARKTAKPSQDLSPRARKKRNVRLGISASDEPSDAGGDEPLASVPKASGSRNQAAGHKPAAKEQKKTVRKLTSKKKPGAKASVEQLSTPPG